MDQLVECAETSQPAGGYSREKKFELRKLPKESRSTPEAGPKSVLGEVGSPPSIVEVSACRVFELLSLLYSRCLTLTRRSLDSGVLVCPDSLTRALSTMKSIYLVLAEADRDP